MRTRYTNLTELKADLAAVADSLPYMEGDVTLALPAIAMPPEAVAQIALDNLPGAGDPMRAWFTAYSTEGESIRHTPRGEGVMVQIDYQREDGPYPLGVLELLRLPGGTCAPAITAHPGSILALLPAIRTLADLLPSWNVRAVIDPLTEPAEPTAREEGAPRKLRVPKRLKNLNDWRACWRKIKPEWRRGKAYHEIREWLNAQDSSLEFSEDVLAEIIAAGEAGLLDLGTPENSR